MKDQKKKNMVIFNGIKWDYSSNEVLLKYFDVFFDILQNFVILMVFDLEFIVVVVVEEDVCIYIQFQINGIVFKVQIFVGSCWYFRCYIILQEV